MFSTNLGYLPKPSPSGAERCRVSMLSSPSGAREGQGAGSWSSRCCGPHGVVARLLFIHGLSRLEAESHEDCGVECGYHPLGERRARAVDTGVGPPGLLCSPSAACSLPPGSAVREARAFLVRAETTSSSRGHTGHGPRSLWLEQTQQPWNPGPGCCRCFCPDLCHTTSRSRRILSPDL